MRIERRLGVRSAYGQLVLLVFLPIAILASVGVVLVFGETRRALQSEQDTLAQSALIRYEPMIRPLLLNLESGDKAVEESIRQMGVNGMTRALLPNASSGMVRRYMTDKMYVIQSEQHVQRVAILAEDGTPIVSAGYNADAPWGKFDVSADGVWRLPTPTGTAYGMPLQVETKEGKKRYWLFVDMDDEPFIIAYYRIIVALVVTGLTTVLLLLLILSMYAKRWIAPIYEMRLFLQRLSTNNLAKPLQTKSDGEFYLLQQELNQALARLEGSFQELKEHSRQTEADLQQAFDEMEMQNISIRRAHDLVVSSSETKSAFLANISHELRTPLNAIDGFINLLARHGNLDAKQNLYVHTIKKSSAHLLALVNDVLDFSKIEAGKLILEHQSFDLYDCIYEVADMLSPLAQEKQLRMSVLFYQDVPKAIFGDSLRVKQILTNLLGNAIKFTDTGAVLVRVRLDDDIADDGSAIIHISVEDSGRGISKEAQAQLFKSFGQGDLSVTRRYGGTGLGLVISKQLTHLMGGEIGFFDNVQENVAVTGATFWFTMPTGLSETEALTSSEDNIAPMLPTQRLLAWFEHSEHKKVLSLLLADTAVVLDEVDSLVALLEKLSAGERYEWVLVDGFSQKGGLTALLSQVRRYHQGRLAVFGYQVALDGASLAQFGAEGLYEPLDRRQVYQLLSGMSNQATNTRASQWQGVKILAVDDHAPNLLVLEALLHELGIDMVMAESGFDAIDIVSKSYADGQPQSRIDLIFMDIQMPTMSGLEASLAIRKIEAAYPECSPIPIVALTAHGLSDEKAQLVQAGLNDYVIKPMAHNELLRVLQKWLGNSSTAAPLDGAMMGDDAFALVKLDKKQHMTGLAVLDWQDALARAAHKPDLAKKLLTMLQASASNEQQALNTAWAIKDGQALIQIAHRIVGATRYTGAPRLRAVSEWFEERCRKVVANGQDIGVLEPDFLLLQQALSALMMAEVEAMIQMDTTKTQEPVHNE